MPSQRVRSLEKQYVNGQLTEGSRINIIRALADDFPGNFRVFARAVLRSDSGVCTEIVRKRIT